LNLDSISIIDKDNDRQYAHIHRKGPKTI